MKKPPIIHPFLFGLYFVLFLYSINLFEVELVNVLSAAIAVVGFAGVVMLIPLMLKRGVGKTALMLSVFFLVFFSYGHLYLYIYEIDIFGLTLFRHRFLLPIFVLVLASAGFAIVRSKKDLINLNKIFNATAVFLIVLPLASIGMGFAGDLVSGRDEQDARIRAAGGLENGGRVSDRPDIYYLIFDEFASLRQIKQTYDYDNSAFAQKLNQKGFHVTSGSRTSYLESAWSISAALNMRHLQDNTDVKNKIHYSNVVDILKSRGYKYIHFGSVSSYTAKSPRADININFSYMNDFALNLLKSSMLHYFVHISFNFTQDLVLNTLDALVEMSKTKMPEPKFVFAHILCPHGPFVFGPSGEAVPFKDAMNRVDKSVYLGQYIYTSSRIDQLVTDILANSAKPPAIILQSDHGVRFAADEYAQNIFSAYYLPTECASSLPKSINPVDNFRIIFNCLFGTTYELLGDRDAKARPLHSD